MSYNNNYGQQQQPQQPPPGQYGQQQGYQQNPNVRPMMQQQQPPGNFHPQMPQQQHQPGSGPGNFPPQGMPPRGPNFPPGSQAPGQNYMQSLTPEQHRQFQYAKQQPSSSQMPVRHYLRQTINTQPTDSNIPVVTVSQPNQGPSSTQAEQGSVAYTNQGPSSNLGPPSSAQGAPTSVGPLAPGSVGQNPTSVGPGGPTSVGVYGGPTSVGFGPTSVGGIPPQQPFSVGASGPTSVGPGGGPHSTDPGLVKPFTYSEYPPKDFDPVGDLKILILKDLRKAITDLNSHITTAAAHMRNQIEAQNPSGANPNNAENPGSISVPPSVEKLSTAEFSDEEYQKAYLRFFAVCDRIEARVSLLTSSFRYHNRMQKICDAEALPAQVVKTGYAKVLQPFVESMRTERKRMLETVNNLTKSLQDYRKTADEGEYLFIYNRKRKHEGVENKKPKPVEMIDGMKVIKKRKVKDEFGEYEEILVEEEITDDEEDVDTKGDKDMPVKSTEEEQPSVLPIEDSDNDSSLDNADESDESSMEGISHLQERRIVTNQKTAADFAEHLYDFEDDGDESLPEDESGKGFYDDEFNPLEQHFLDDFELQAKPDDDDNISVGSDDARNFSQRGQRSKYFNENEEGDDEDYDETQVYGGYEGDYQETMPQGEQEYEEDEYSQQGAGAEGSRQTTDNEDSRQSKSFEGFPRKRSSEEDESDQKMDFDEDTNEAPRLRAEGPMPGEMDDDDDDFDPPPPVSSQNNSL